MEMAPISQKPMQKRTSNFFGEPGQIEQRGQYLEKQLRRVAIGPSNPLELGIHSLWKKIAQRSRVVPKALCDHRVHSCYEIWQSCRYEPSETLD